MNLFGGSPTTQFTGYIDPSDNYIDSISDPSLWPSQEAYDEFLNTWNEANQLAAHATWISRFYSQILMWYGTPTHVQIYEDAATAAKADALEVLTTVMGEEEAQQVLNAELAQADVEAENRFNEIRASYLNASEP